MSIAKVRQSGWIILIAASIVAAGIAPVAFGLDLPDRVEVPEDGNGDAIPDPLAAALSAQMCGRDAARTVFQSASALVENALGTCVESSPNTWTYFPAPARTLLDLTVPDPNQDFATGATPIDADGDGVPARIDVLVRMLTIRADSYGRFTYVPAAPISVPLTGADPNDDPADPCAASTPLPSVGPVHATVTPQTDGDVAYDLGVRVQVGCDVVLEPAYGNTGPALPKTVSGVPTGAYVTVDADGDGVPSQFRFATENVTIEDTEGTTTRASAPPIVVPGPDSDDAAGDPCARARPIPHAGPPQTVVTPNPDGSVAYTLGAAVTYPVPGGPGCATVPPVTGVTASLLPQQVSFVPTGQVLLIDLDADGLPGRILVLRENVTILTTAGNTRRDAAPPIDLLGPDPDDTNPSPVGWIFTRDTDGDRDSDFNELSGVDHTQNPTSLAAFLDRGRTLDDPDGDGFTSAEETSAGTRAEDPRSHPNRPPTITLSPAAPSIDENVLVTIDVAASDPDPDLEQDPVDAAVNGEDTDVPTIACDISALVGATGAATGPGAYRVTWRPDFSQGRAAPYSLSCTATDGGYALGGSESGAKSTTASASIAVADVNARPSIALGAASITVAENATGFVTATIADPAPNSTTVSVTVSGAPWATWNATAGRVELAPTFSTVAHPATSGSFTITITANDGVTPPATATIAVTVTDVNRAPSLALSPPPTNGVYFATENVAMTPIVLERTDADSDTVTLTLTSPATLPPGATFHAAAGVLTWTPDYDAGNGTYSFAFSGSDGHGGTATTSFSVTVSETNRPPTIALPGNAFTSIAEGQCNQFALLAGDPDAESVTVALTGPATQPTWVSFNATSRVFEACPDATTVEHPAASAPTTFTWRATDSNGASSSVQHTITVTNGNVAPALSPTAAPPASVSENALLSVGFTATDADAPSGDVATLSLLSGPTGATLSAGAVSWTPSYDYVSHPTVTGTAPASFTVRATDRLGLTTDYAFSVTVFDVNRPPVLAFGAPAAGGSASVAENASLSFTVTATDPDGDAATVSSVLLPAGATFANGSFSYSPGFGVVVHPSTSLASNATFRANDGFGAGNSVVDRNVTVTVQDVNRPPSAALTFTARGYMLVGENATIAPRCASSTDPDPEDALALACDWSWGDGTPAETNSTPSHSYTVASNPGSFTLTLTVRDLVGATSMRTSSFRVYAPNADSDSDGLTNKEELLGTRNPYGGAPTLPDVSDTDGDLELDGTEVLVRGTDPNNKRSNSADRDGDGLPNGVEGTLFSRTGLNFFNPDDESQPVSGGVPLYNGDLLLRNSGSPTARGHVFLYNDVNANGAFDPNRDRVLVDSDLYYVLSPETKTVTIKTSLAGLSDTAVQAGDMENPLIVRTPDGQTILVPETALSQVEVEPCAPMGVFPHAGSDGGFAFCLGADVEVAGLSVARKAEGDVVGPFPVTLPQDTVDADAMPFVTVTPADLATGAPTTVRVKMERLTIHKDGTVTSAAAPDRVVPVGPSVRVVPCAGEPVRIRDPDGGVDYCLGADVFVDGVQRAEQIEGFAAGPFPRTIPTDVPLVTDPQFVTANAPDTTTGAKANYAIKTGRITLNRPGASPQYSSTPGPTLGGEVGPSIRIVPCAGPPVTVRDPDGGVDYCFGADVYVDGTRQTEQVRGFAAGPFPVRIPVSVPAADQPGFVTASAPDVATGAKASFTVAMQNVTVHRAGAMPQYSATPAPSIGGDVGPSVRVVPCVSPGASLRPLPDEGVDYCFGADVYVDGALVLGRAEGTARTFPFTVARAPAVDATDPVAVVTPNVGTGAPGKVTVKAKDYTIHRPDASPLVTSASAAPYEITLPSVLVVPCANPGVRENPGGGLDYCFGADVVVDGVTIPGRREGTISTFPFVVPVPVPDADRGASVVTVTQPNVDDGTAASVSIHRETVTIRAPGSIPPFTTAPAPDETLTLPSVRVVGCTNPGVTRRTQSDGGFEYCFGADVFVDGDRVAERQAGSVTGPFPVTLPVDTVNATAEPPASLRNPTPSQPAALVVAMERVSIDKDGNVRRTPAPTQTIPLGPGFGVTEQCASVAESPSGGFDYCFGAIVTIDGTEYGEILEGNVDSPLPYQLPVDVPNATASDGITFTQANLETGSRATVVLRMDKVTIDTNGAVRREANGTRTIAFGPGLQVQTFDAAGQPTNEPARVDRVVVTLWFDRDGDNVRDDGETTVYETPPLSYDRTDVDRDFLPDSEERVVCSVESGTDPTDGSCNPGKTDYSFPPGIPRRP